MTNLERAKKDGYIDITGPDTKQKITYITSINH